MKCLAITLVAALLAAESPAAPLRILASFYPVYIATLNVAGGVPGVEVASLAPPVAGCLHDYSLSPRDLKELARADILVVNGLGMESFIDEAVKQAHGLTILDASRGIELLDGNPHAWVSISLAMKQVQNIADGLAQHDPEHADLYRRNAGSYLAKLDALRAKMHAQLKDLKTRDIVTCHEAFPYFTGEFDLRILAVIEREPGSEPSARELAETIELVRKSGAAALFAEPQYSAKAVDMIAAETGAKVYTLDPAVTGPMEADAYLGIMERNLETLIAALKEAPSPRSKVESPK